MDHATPTSQSFYICSSASRRAGIVERGFPGEHIRARIAASANRHKSGLVQQTYFLDLSYSSSTVGLWKVNPRIPFLSKAKSWPACRSSTTFSISWELTIFYPPFIPRCICGQMCRMDRRLAYCYGISSCATASHCTPTMNGPSASSQSSLVWALRMPMA